VVTTVKQIVLAFIIGTLFYAPRSVTGSIVFVMIVHALWDFGTFTWIGGKHATGVAAANYLSLASLPLMLIMLVVFAIGAKRMFTQPVEAA
jgi:hypothetical protein